MTTMTTRPTLQDMVKHAMSGAAHRVAVNLEAARQIAATEDGETKEASAPQPTNGHFATEQAVKLANALGYIADQVIKEAEGPGDGPGALQVMEATSSETNIDAGQSGQATSQNQPPKSPSTQTEEVQTGKANTGLETNDDMQHPAQPVEPISNEKTSSAGADALAASNFEHLMKVAKGDPEGHHVRRALLGNATSAAIEAEKGKKLKAFGAGIKHEVGQTLKGIAAGGLGGAALGAGAAALSKGKIRPGQGAAVGGNTGMNVGSMIGSIKGRHGRKASEIHGRYSKHRDKEAAAPIELIRKIAEDAINPAQISGGGTTDPAEPPAAASGSEDKVPNEPSDVNKQKQLISSNQAAIDYTKGQAKADPKSDVAQVLREPPLSKSTDPVLHKTLDHASSAGVKISSAQSMAKTASQVGAQRALISRLVKQAQDEQDEKKKKQSTGMAPSTPQAATGINASTMGM